MGTFARLFNTSGGIIPKHKRNEFAEKIEKIFQVGGMMEIERVQLYGKKISMLRKARMHENGMDFYYNYFEDDSWENAGFNRESCYVWSNKIGGRHFHQTVVAAYVLEELYTEGTAITMVNGEMVTSWKYVGWINYLFDEKNHVKNFDPWKLFETIHYSEDEDIYVECYDFGNKRYAFIGRCEIYAVLNGYEEAISVYNTKDKGELEELVLRAMEKTVEGIKFYRNNCENDKESQLQILIEMFRAYYNTDEEINSSLYAKDEKLKYILAGLFISDAPAFVIKVISEIYEVEFWDLWEKIRDVTKRKRATLYGNDGYHIVPISTEDFFGQSADDMLPYWEEGCKFEFSEELKEWFKALKEEYNNLLDTEFAIDNVLKYIVDLLEEANENYYHIFVFYDFFQETVENLHDKRYQTLWRIFDTMIHDPEMKKAGDVIFVPDEPGHESEGLHYFGKQPKRRLSGYWDIMASDKRNNKARVTFRKYMALLGNKDLRCKVFGF